MRCQRATLAPLLAAVVVLLHGCALMPGAKPVASPDTFTFAATAGTGANSSDSTPECPTLLVSSITSAPGLHTPQMAYASAASQLGFFAYARWADVPARLLEPLLIADLQASNAFAYVVGTPAPVRPELRLDGRFLSIVQHFDAANSEVRVSLQALVVAPRSGQLVAVRHFNVAESIGARSAAAGAAATDVAIGRLRAELTDFVVAVARDADVCNN